MDGLPLVSPRTKGKSKGESRPAGSPSLSLILSPFESFSRDSVKFDFCSELVWNLGEKPPLVAFFVELSSSSLEHSDLGLPASLSADSSSESPFPD